MVRGPEITGRVNDFVAVCGVPLESCTRTVNVEEPVVVGVPLISPVEEFRVNPTGSEPTVTDQFKGAVPPVAASVLEYGLFAMAVFRGLVVLMLSVVELTVSANALVAVCGVPEESCT